MFKRPFLEGLALLVPFLVAILAALFILTELALPLDEFFTPFFPKSSWTPYVTKLLSFLFTILIVMGVGFLATQWMIRWLLGLAHAVFSKTPFVKTIYLSAYQVITTLLKDENQALSHTSFLKYGDSPGIFLGFTGGSEILINSELYTTVLQIGTPNPLMGFLLFIPKNNVQASSITFQDGLKWSISIGTTSI